MKDYQQRFFESFPLYSRTVYFFPIACLTFAPLNDRYVLIGKLCIIVLAAISGILAENRSSMFVAIGILGWIGLSAFWSASPSASVQGMFLLVYCMCMYLLFRYSRFRVDELLWGIRVLVIVAFVLAADDGLRQLLYGHDSLVQALDQEIGNSLLFSQDVTQAWIDSLSGRVFSRFALPSQFAGFLLMLLPLNCLLVLRERYLVGRIFWGIVLALNSLLFFFTKSFGAWLSFFCVGILSLYLLLSSRGKLRWQTKLLGGIGGVVVSGALLYIIGILRGQHLWDVQGNNPLWFRFLNWKAAFFMLRDAPFLGWGFSTFGKLYPQYMVPGANESQYVHNSYLQIASELGIIGIVIIVWLVGAWTVSAVKLLQTYSHCEASSHSSLKEYRKALDIRFACFLGGLGFLLHNVVDFDFYVFPLSILGISLLALTGNVCHLNREKFQKSEPLKLPTFFIRYGLIVCVLLGIYMIDHLYAQECRIGEEAGIYMHSAQYQKASELLSAPELSLVIPDYIATHASALLGLKQFHPAIDQFERAIAKEPITPWFHAALAEAYLGTQNVSMAYLEIRQAAELFPQKPGYQQRAQELQDIFSHF